MRKILRSFKLSKIEFIKFQLDQTVNHTVRILNPTEITVLAYVYIYGVDAKQQILQDRILTNLNAVINYISKLTNQGFIIKERSLTDENAEAEKKPGKKPYTSLKLNPGIVIIEENFIQISTIELDHDSDQVYHPNFRK